MSSEVPQLFVVELAYSDGSYVTRFAYEVVAASTGRDARGAAQQQLAQRLGAIPVILNTQRVWALLSAVEAWD